MICLPSSTTVPRPVLVSTPPSPAPPQRMRSMKVPMGLNSAFSAPDWILALVRGLVPTWVVIMASTRPASTSRLTPWPGSLESME